MYETLTSNIVGAIADSSDIESDELDVVVGDHIDLDAVEQLAKHSDSAWTLNFELPKRDVTVKSDGEILVDGRQKRDWTSA